MKLQKPYRMSLFNLVVQMAILHFREQAIARRHKALRNELLKRVSKVKKIGPWFVRAVLIPRRLIPEHWVEKRVRVKFHRRGREPFVV